MTIVRRVADYGLLAITALVFVVAWLAEPYRPSLAVPGNGWWANYDQTHYIRSTLAFARGSFSPDEHWYLPLYSMAAVPFLHLIPGDPFMPVNLICLLLSAWASRALGQIIAPNHRWSGQIALALFIGAELIPASIRTVWTTPWTSSLATPLMLGCMLFALRVMRGERVALNGFLCGLTGALVGGCRPLDGAMLLALVGTIGLASVARQTRLRPVPVIAWCAAIAAGAVLGVVPSLLTYLAIWGAHMSPYLNGSAQIGFEPHLLLLHWVEIMISPQPALPDGVGIIGRLPIVATGIVGLVALVIVQRRAADALVAALVLSSMLMYLAYRDLHAPGIWAYHNIHYFKWSLGILALYTILGVRLAFRRPRHIAWMAVFFAVLVCWHASVVRVGARGHLLAPDHFTIATPTMNTLDAIVIPGAGAPDRIYFGTHHLTLNTALVAPIADYKAFPIAGGLMLQPLRAWRSGLLDVTVTPGVTLNGDPVEARVALSPGIPCWFDDWPRSCEGHSILPAPRLQPNVPVSFGSTLGQELALGGWCPPDPDGRWTGGTHSVLRFALGAADRPRDGILHFALSASAIVPPGAPPLHVTVWSGERLLTRWTWTDGATRQVDFDVTQDLVGPDGDLGVELRINDPRRPRDLFAGSSDVRELGIFVRSIVWNAH